MEQFLLYNFFFLLLFSELIFFLFFFEIIFCLYSHELKDGEREKKKGEKKLQQEIEGKGTRQLISVLETRYHSATMLVRRGLFFKIIFTVHTQRVIHLFLSKFTLNLECIKRVMAASLAASLVASVYIF